MRSPAQAIAARRNIKKASATAKRKRTIARLPKRARIAPGKQASKMARQKKP